MPAQFQVRSRFRGLSQAIRKIELLAKGGEEGLQSGLEIIGNEIVADIKDSRPGAGVPRDTGALADTVQAVPGRHGGRSGILLQAGSSTVDYALRQHEDMSLHHPVGEARYLTRGVERFVAKSGGSPKAQARVANTAVRRARSL